MAHRMDSRLRGNDLVGIDSPKQEPNKSVL
jgi:hypothetical protein